MKTSKYFLHPESQIPALSIWKIIVGIIIGLIFSFIFYNFLYLMREGLRFTLFVSEEDPLLVLSDSIMKHHNLFFAFLSVIFGQSLCINYWFNTPMGKYRKARHKMRSVVNDQRYLNYFFLHWFTTLAMTMAMSVGGLWIFTAYEPEVFSNYDFIFFLFIPVLFLQSWVTIRRIFRFSLRWMVIVAFGLMTLAFGFSYFSPINYYRLNELMLATNPWSTYDINLPDSEYYIRMQHNRRFGTIMMVKEKNPTAENDSPLILVKPFAEEFYLVSLDTLAASIRYWDSLMRPEDFGPYVLHIDHTILMKEVNLLKKHISLGDVISVQYGAVPVDRIYVRSRYKHAGLSLRLPSYYGGDPKEWEKVSQELIHKDTILNIFQLSSDNLLVNGEKMKREKFKKIFGEIIGEYQDYAIKYYINSKLQYQDYISMLSDVFMVLQKYKDAYSLNHFGKEYNMLDHKDFLYVRSKFPFYLLEITDDMEWFDFSFHDLKEDD